MNDARNDSQWGLSKIGINVVLGATALMALLFLMGVGMSIALMPAQGDRAYEIPKLLELWWTLSRWMYVLVSVVMAVGLGLLAQAPRYVGGRTLVIVALLAEVAGLGIDLLQWLISLVARGGYGGYVLIEGISALSGVVACAGVITLVIGVGSMTQSVTGRMSLPAVGVVVLTAAIGYLVPLMSRIIKVPLTYPGSPSALVLNLISVVRYGAMLFVLWQGVRAISSAPAAGAPMGGPPMGGPPMGGPPMGGERRW